MTGVLVAAGLGACAILLTGALGLYSKDTFVTKTACTRDPSSRACAEQRQAVARKEPLKNPCISVQRVTGTKGRNCKRFYVKRYVQISSKEVQNLEQGASKGTSVITPTPGSGGVDAGHHKGTPGGTPGGTKQPPKSQEPQHGAESEPPSTDTGTDTEAVTTPDTEPPPPSNPPQTSEVQPGVLTPALEQVCSLADHLLHLC